MEEVLLKELFRFVPVFKGYKNNAGSLFSAAPMEEGEKALSGYRLTFRELDAGFAVIADCRGDIQGEDAELLKPFDDNAKLSFVMHVHDDNFFKNSELPYDPPGEYVYYLNNLDANERRTKLLLERKGIEVSEKVLLRGQPFSTPLRRHENSNVLQPLILDCRGNEISGTGDVIVIDELKDEYRIDLSEHPDGQYSIRYGEEEEIFYSARSSLKRTAPLLIVEIFTGPDIPAEYSIIKTVNGKQYADPKDFGAHFGIYSSWWRYKIYPLDLDRNTWTKIKTNNDNYTFVPERQKTGDEDEPVIFTSARLMEEVPADFEAGIYYQDWNNECWTNPKYYYCGGNYGIWIEDEFRCRYHKHCSHYHHHNKNCYPYDCPARQEDFLISLLPRLDEYQGAAYYEEDGKFIAEVSLYIVEKDGKFEGEIRGKDEAVK